MIEVQITFNPDDSEGVTSVMNIARECFEARVIPVLLPQERSKAVDRCKPKYATAVDAAAESFTGGYRVGDKARVVTRGSSYNGLVGTVVEKAGTEVGLRFDGSTYNVPLTFHVNEIEPVGE